MPKLYIDPTKDTGHLRYCVAGPNYSWYLLSGNPPDADVMFGPDGDPDMDAKPWLAVAVSEVEAFGLCAKFRHPDQEPALKAWIDAKRAETLTASEPRTVELPGPADPWIESLVGGKCRARRGMTWVGPERESPEEAHLDLTATAGLTDTGADPLTPTPAGLGVRLVPPTPGQCLDALVANLMGQPAHLREPLLELAHAAVREDPTP